MSGVRLSIPESIHQIANVVMRNRVERNVILCLAALFVSLLWNTVDHKHNDILSQGDMFQSAIRQSTAESFSVDNLSNVVHYFFLIGLLASKGERSYKANTWIIICSKRGMKQTNCLVKDRMNLTEKQIVKPKKKPNHLIVL